MSLSNNTPLIDLLVQGNPELTRRDVLLAETKLALDLLDVNESAYPERLNFLNGQPLSKLTTSGLSEVRDLCHQRLIEDMEVELFRSQLAYLRGEYDDMTTRDEVYDVIDGERDYQDNIIETDPSRHSGDEPDHTVGDYLTMLATYLRKAQDAWTNQGGVEGSLHQIRKIAAIAVHCMEDHGAPARELPEPEGEPEVEEAEKPELPTEAVLTPDWLADSQYELAKNPYQFPLLLQFLAKSADWRVRATVAQNPNTPALTVMTLTSDSDPRVRQDAREAYEDAAATKAETTKGQGCNACATGAGHPESPKAA